MKYSTNEIKVGFVVVASTVAFLTFIIFLSGSGFWKKTVPYKTELNMSVGLEAGDLVRYHGMKVGAITDVHVSPTDPEKIEIFFLVDEKTPVKKDSKIFPNYIGLLGSFYLEIIEGSLQEPNAPANYMLSSSEVLQFSELIGQVNSITASMGSVLKNVDDLFAQINTNVVKITEHADQLILNANEFINEDNQKKVDSILDNVDLIVKSNAETIEGVLKNLRSMLAQVDTLSGSLNRVFVDNEAQIQEMIKLLNSFITTGEQTLGDFQELFGVSKEDIRAILSNTNAATQHFSEFAAEIHGNRERIDTMIKNIEGVSTRIHQFLQFADQESGSDVRAVLENLLASSDSLKFVLQRVRDNNEKFEKILTDVAATSGNAADLTTFAVEQKPAVQETLQHVRDVTATAAEQRERVTQTMTSIASATAHIDTLAQQAEAQWPQFSVY